MDSQRETTLRPAIGCPYFEIRFPKQAISCRSMQSIAVGYSYLIKLYSLYKQRKYLATVFTFSVAMRGLNECMSEMQSKY